MKRILTILLVLTMIMPLAACGDKVTTASDSLDTSSSEVAFGEIRWPTSEIASLLPTPESKIGKIEWEASDGFVIYIGETSKEQYDNYVNSCESKGFKADYRKGDDYYYADNDAGYHLTLKYEGNNTMFVRIDEPEEIENTPSPSPEESGSSVAANDEKGVSKETPASSTNVDSDFKVALDSYEAFFYEYVEFMKKYKDSTDAASMLSDYTKYMTKYVDMMGEIDGLNTSDLSTEETLYYLEVTTRITKKLAEVAQ